METLDFVVVLPDRVVLAVVVRFERIREVTSLAVYLITSMQQLTPLDRWTAVCAGFPETIFLRFVPNASSSDDSSNAGASSSILEASLSAASTGMHRHRISISAKTHEVMQTISPVRLTPRDPDPFVAFFLLDKGKSMSISSSSLTLDLLD
jgi:hypothetical protein